MTFSENHEALYEEKGVTRLIWSIRRVVNRTYRISLTVSRNELWGGFGGKQN